MGVLKQDSQINDKCPLHMIIKVASVNLSRRGKTEWSYLSSPKLEAISGVRKNPGRQKHVRSLGAGPGHGGVGHQFLGAGHWFRVQGSNNKLWGQIDLGVNFTHPDIG